MTEDHESLSAALARTADDLERAVAAAHAVHRQYVRLCETDRTWRRLDDTLTDEVRHKRTEVGLYAAQLLAEHLRDESREAHLRYPAIDANGEELPKRPPTTIPADVLTWWRELSPRDQDRLVSQAPQWVGGADGIPVADRHRANLLVLDAEIERRTREERERRDEELAGGTSHGSAPETDPETSADPTGLLEAASLSAAGATTADVPRDEAARQEARDLRGLLKLKAFFTPGETPEGLEKVDVPHEERFLYLLDARDYPLKAAVLIGDLDAAEHVVLHVPGATTTVELRFYREMLWMNNLRNEAGRIIGTRRDIPGTSRVAVLDWIGYHAPFDITAKRKMASNGLSFIVPGEAINERYARDAAPALVRCALGLRALVEDHARLIASGHSYGGAVTGLALMETDVFDAAIITGAPGIFATSLDQLKVDPSRFWISIAPTDLVGLLGLFGIECLKLPGVTMISPYARRTSYPDSPWVVLLPTVGHEAYYNAGTATLHHLAAIVADRVEKVKTTTWFGMVRADGGSKDEEATQDEAARLADDEDTRTRSDRAEPAVPGSGPAPDDEPPAADGVR